MPKESMSFEQINFCEIIKENWEESTIRSKFENKKHLWIIFKSRVDFEAQSEVNLNDLILEKVMFWNMPISDLDGSMHRVWEDTVLKIKQNKYDDYIQKVIAGRVAEKYTDKINAIQDKFNAWKDKNPNIANNPDLLAVAPEYQEYKRAMKNLQNMQAADLAEVYMSTTGEKTIPSNSHIWKKALDNILNRTILNKNGGVLIPKNKFLK